MACARWVLVCLVMLGACTSSANSDRAPTTNGTGPLPSESTPSVASQITLTLKLSEPPVEWREVAFLPAGDADDQIGIDRCYHCEAVTPAALAVGPDGSFWIGDTVKHRIAHFGQDGSFLGAIYMDVGPADLAFAGDRLFALPRPGARTVTSVPKDGDLEEIVVALDGRAHHVQALVGGQDRLTAVIAGAERALGRYWAVAFIDEETGVLSPAPGVAVSGDTWIDLVPLIGERPPAFEVRWLDGRTITQVSQVTMQAIRNGSPVRTTVGDTFVRTATANGVAAIGSMRSAAWYLEIPADGGRPTLERIPYSGFVGDLMMSLSVGPDGRVYWMQLKNDGLHIYRR